MLKPPALIYGANNVLDFVQVRMANMMTALKFASWYKDSLDESRRLFGDEWNISFLILAANTHEIENASIRGHLVEFMTTRHDPDLTQFPTTDGDIREARKTGALCHRLAVFQLDEQTKRLINFFVLPTKD